VTENEHQEGLIEIDNSEVISSSERAKELDINLRNVLTELEPISPLHPLNNEGTA